MFNCNRIKKGENRGYKLECHAKNMMSIKTDKVIKEIPSMCHLGRTLRDKNKGGG
jgi:hypothetical protein